VGELLEEAAEEFEMTARLLLLPLEQDAAEAEADVEEEASP